MKEEKKILIDFVLILLAQRDPWWNEDNPDAQIKFKEIYDAWRFGELRKNKHAAPFYIDSWNRGWLPEADFERFRDYAMQ